MPISNWFRRWQKKSDGYDPNAGGKHAYEEREARRLIRERVFADPFSDATRRTRRALLGLSVLALLINAGMTFGLSRVLSNPANTEEIAALLSVISIGIVYFLIMFVVSAGHEYSRWRLSGHSFAAQSLDDWAKGINDNYHSILQQLENLASNKKSSTSEKMIREANKSVPDLSLRIERTWDHYISTSRVQMIRIVVLDFALPLLVAILALLKVASLAGPMIWRIASA